jgi:aerobic-type carbon monoxide dehydrogenase small subunit (CoxS/CutS family)
MSCVELLVNNETRTVSTAYGDGPLLWALRDDLGLTGSHYGCGIGSCGSCMVLVDDAPTRSCQVTATDIGTKPIVTIEGLTAKDGPLTPVQQAFAEVPLQCMWCVPGHVMTAIDLLATTPTPSPSVIEAAIAENLCRCGGYNQIRKAIARAIEITAASR